MKKTKSMIVALCALCLCGQSLSAQTNSFTDGFKQMVAAVSNAKDWNLVGGYGHSLSGSHHLAFEDVVYNFNENVGVLVGFDQLWDSGAKQKNAVRGGVTLSLPVHPFGFIGSTFLTNVVGRPFVSDCIASGIGNSSVGNIVASGISFDLVKFKNFELLAGILYEHRLGQSHWDGNYGAGFIGLSRRF